MKEFKGTKGPWKLSEGWIDKHVSVDAEHHGAIALVLSDIESDYSCSEKKLEEKRAELFANAKLIAAAPDLLEALQDMFSGWKYIREQHGDLYGVGWDRAEEKVMSAINKALGESK